MDMEENFIERARKVKMVLLDVDGVMTDGSIILDNEGNEFKVFNVRDGHALKLAGRSGAGLVLVVITGRESTVVARRMKELGIEELYQGVRDKLAVYREVVNRYGFSDTQTAYMGDDVVDVPLLEVVGLPAVPADADSESSARAFFTTGSRGGRGAVREFIEKILRAQGLWDDLIGRQGAT